MQEINDQLDSAYLKIDGMLALINYMQLDCENRLKNKIDPQLQTDNQILLAGYAHEVALNNANGGLTGLTVNLTELQELITNANHALLQSNHKREAV